MAFVKIIIFTALTLWWNRVLGLVRRRDGGPKGAYVEYWIVLKKLDLMRCIYTHRRSG